MTSTTDAPPGFSFDNIHRNALFEKLASSHGTTLPKFKKTGTTIAGLVFANGVVLGADTRATNGTEVAEKNCEKIHPIAPNIYCCGAGTAADTERVTAMVSSNLQLLRYEMHESQSRVVTACTHLKRYLFRYMGYVSAALVLGGCDVNGPHIFQIYPHGSTGKLPYTTMGSGSLAAMAVFESSWQTNMEEEAAIQLVQRAIGAGIWNDLGSGSNCDICVIRTDGTMTMHRNMITPNELGPLRANVQSSGRLTMTPGTTPVLETKQSRHIPTIKEQYASLEDTTEQMEVES